MNKTTICAQALGRAGVLVFLCLGLVACGIMAPIANRQPPAEEGQKRVSELVGQFEQACLGRDLMSNPYPNAARRIPEKTGIWEVKPGSCNFWGTAGSNWGEYDKTFVTYDRGRVVREFKRRFGVIYHQSAPISPYCARGDRHFMLLRDGTTWVTLKILARDHRNRLCDQDRWLAYGFQLSPGLPLFLDSRDPDEPYVVDRLDVVNLDRLNNKERQQVAERWARMSTAEKNEHAKGVADAIRSINGSVEIATKQFREDQASQREFNQRLQRQEEESAAALNEMLIGKIGELYQESAKINARNTERSQQRAAMSRANAAFSNIDGFDASQLPSSIQLRGTTSASYDSNGNGGDSSTVKNDTGIRECDRAGSLEASNQCLCRLNGGTVDFNDLGWFCSDGKEAKKTGPGTPR